MANSLGRTRVDDRLGTKRPIGREDLRETALDGGSEELLDWKPVKAGDFYYSPAGTVHAIGAGISLIEVRQNVDLTHRLYDYGRPRELHLDAGRAVSVGTPFVAQAAPGKVSPDCTILAEGPKFVLERWPVGDRSVALPEGLAGWLVPVSGESVAGAVAVRAGECAMETGTVEIKIAEGGDVLFAYPGSRRI